jgi:tetratricopeptide (TPR) repeat protein
VQFHLNQGNPAAAERILATARVREAFPQVLARAQTALDQHQALSPPPVPAAARLHHELARDFVRQSRMVEAIEHFRAALRVAPDYLEARYNYATFLALGGRGDEALHLYLGRIATAGPADVSGHAHTRLLGLIAEAFRMNGQTESALRTAEYAFRRAPSDPAIESMRQRYRSAAQPR